MNEKTCSDRIGAERAKALLNVLNKNPKDAKRPEARDNRNVFRARNEESAKFLAEKPENKGEPGMSTLLP